MRTGLPVTWLGWRCKGKTTCTIRPALLPNLAIRTGYRDFGKHHCRAIGISELIDGGGLALVDLPSGTVGKRRQGPRQQQGQSQNSGANKCHHDGMLLRNVKGHRGTQIVHAHTFLDIGKISGNTDHP